MKQSKVFSMLQSIGGAFMLPIALLPVAGLMLGIGASFTNEVTLEMYNLTWLLGAGSVLGSLLLIFKNTGQIIFANLPFLFAIGVASGLAEKEKYVAGIAGAIGFLVMHQTINSMLAVYGMLEPDVLPAGTIGSVLGIVSLEMGVFGGILVGVGVAALHNKFYMIEFPTMLSFFSGTRFVPIITSLVYLCVGIAMFFLWGYVQNAMRALGMFVNATGYFGTFLYGCIERALIPFGLHHVFYMPFWQTALGGTAIIDGNTIAGAQNIFFAELASPSTIEFSVEATKYMAGKFPIMLFGLPAAALAMYKTARPEHRKKVGGLLFSAALTCIVSGITEPLEFSFLFLAPVLYVVHTIFCGLSFMCAHIVGGAVGQTFSGSLIDFTLFGILQGNDKTSWLNLVFVGLGFVPLYYLTFKYMILKLNLLTPGRAEDEAEAKLFSKEEYVKRNDDDAISALIVTGLGGVGNIQALTCCATRLRVNVRDPEAVQEDVLNETGAHGVICNGKGVQIIYGTNVANIKAKVEVYMEMQPLKKVES
jgi:PTS system D-glucosamine-specific IIC component/PTS system maltose and glucose-specific IIC component